MGKFAGLSRREFMALAASAGGAAALNSLAGPVIEKAYAVDPAGLGSFADIEHFVLLMMENRSFDHYFGTMSGVRGFGDHAATNAGRFRQYGFNPATGKADRRGYVTPFRLNTTHGASLDGECINDPTHDWGPQHQCWNHGRMDQWVNVHVANDGATNGPATMGYYTRQDIPVHWALADAFTICDHYFCSVLGPTDPNRLYWISGTIDPDGKAGGPLLQTPTLIPTYQYSWRTFPENLDEAGVSWKVYTSQQAPVASTAVLSGMLQSFKQAADPRSSLAVNGIAPVYPHNFQLDVQLNQLPAVSWVIPPLLNCEHPALPPSYGAQTMIEVLNTLVSNPAVWEKTALIISYDENGGFFDHVTPPTAPPGTPGEYVTLNPLSSVAGSSGIRGPIGLGFRVPGLVISPYSRGGLVASEVFDHTSQLRLIERRFGVDVPNLSAWRRKTVGDMTSAFNFAATPDASKPRLKATQELSTTDTLGECRDGADGLSGSFFGSKSITKYPIPANSMPKVESGPARGRPSGLPADRSTGGDAGGPSSDGSTAPPAYPSFLAPPLAPGLPIVAPSATPTRMKQVGESLAITTPGAPTPSDSTGRGSGAGHDGERAGSGNLDTPWWDPWAPLAAGGALIVGGVVAAAKRGRDDEEESVDDGAAES